MANKYVTPAGAGSKDGTSWDNAFGATEFFTDIVTGGTLATGDTYYIYTGTYTLTGNITTLSLSITTQSAKFVGIENTLTMAVS